MFTQQKPVRTRCSACGEPSLVQDFVVHVSDAGVLIEPLGTPRCLNAGCAKADLVGWAHESPRPQRG